MLRLRLGCDTMGKKFIVFRKKDYIRDLKLRIKEKGEEVQKFLIQDMKNRLDIIPFKDNEVKLYGGKTTSDAARKSAVINSIVGKTVKWVNKNTLRVAVSALEKNFKDSYIGLYYEYGTGTKAKDTNIGLLGTPNRYRFGKKIVTRSKNINYGYGEKGVWRDAGGNLRVTGAKRAGVRDAGFVKYVGADVKAYGWFSKSFSENKMKFIKMYLEAIRSVKITKYIEIAPYYKLGRD